MKRLQRINQFIGRTVSGGEEERMKRNRITRFVFFIAIGFTAVCAAKPTEVQAKNLYLSKKTVPDKLLRSQLKKYDKNKNGILEKNERKKIKELKLEKTWNSINVKGISACTNLQKLTIETADIVKNTKEISKLKNLKTYHVGNANTTFDVSKNKKLENLELMGMTELKSIKLEKNKSLKTFYASCCCKAKKVSIKENKKLEHIWIEDNDIVKEIAIINNRKLKVLMVSGKKLNTVKVLKASKLESLDIFAYKNRIKKVLLDKMKKLECFTMGDIKEKTIPWENMPNLKELYFYQKNADLPDFSKIPKLETLNISCNQLEELDISMLPLLKSIDCENANIKRLKVAENNQIENIRLSNNQLSGVWNLNDFPHLFSFWCDNNKIEKIIAAGHPTLSTLSCRNNNIQEVNTYGVVLDCFYAKGNPNAKIFLMGHSSGDEEYSYDETAKVTYQFG